MIEEIYCSPEVSKLLKEKGFDVPVWTRYEDDDDVIFGDKYNWNNSPMGQISAPTLQMAMKWLRETYHLHILFEISDPSQINPKYYFIVWDTSRQNSYMVDLFDYYEEACDTAIKYCLENLIL